MHKHVYIGVGPPIWWKLHRWVDVEKTADEVILTLSIPKELKKEDIKVEYSEGRLRIRVPRKKHTWERLPIE